MNQNFQNNEYIQKMQKMFQNPEQFKTKQSIKYAISILLGLIPMLAAWIFLRSDIEPYVDIVLKNNILIEGISYGVMWGIAIGMIALSIIGTSIFIKFNTNIKVDVFVPTVTLAIFMSSFYLLPFLNVWMRMLSSIGFFLIGGFISRSILMGYIVFKFQQQMLKMKNENPEMFKNMQNPFQQNGNPTQNPFQNNGAFEGKDKYGYSDLPDTSKTSENDEENKNEDEKEK